MEKQFSLAVAGVEIPNELVLVQRLKNALNSGKKKLNIINGFEVETDSHVRITMGPVIGEVTADSAVIMLELVGPKELVPINTKVYKKEKNCENAELDILIRKYIANEAFDNQEICLA